jgi:VanZ family protein
MRCFLKICSVVVLALLVIMALGPEEWQLRTGLGWEFDHFAGYFAITIFVCLAWPRPIVVGGALMAFGALLEGLQAFTPDRTASLMAAIYGASGALAAALITQLYIRAFAKKVSKTGILEKQ